MDDITKFLEENQYLSACMIESMDIFFADNMLDIYIRREVKQSDLKRRIRYKIRFLNVRCLEWDNSKHELLSARVERSQWIDYIIFKKETSDVLCQLRFFLKDNRLLMISFSGFQWEEIQAQEMTN